MAFESLREQLRDQWSELWAKIEESSAYNTLRERFESQTPEVQRAIIVGGLVFFTMIVLSFPMAYISSSQDYLDQFEENREMILGLLRASRNASGPAPLPPPMPADAMRSTVERVLRNSGLVEEQLGAMEEIPADAIKNLAPAGVVANGLAVQVKTLNLSQVVEVGNALQNSGPGIKLIGLDVVQTKGQTHYYDINARLVSFGIPMFEESESEAPARGGRRSGRGANR